MADLRLSSPCPLCGHAGRRWTAHGERELHRCHGCGFLWIPQGVARTASGGSIYDADSPLFMSEAQAEYYRDDSTVDAARRKVNWIRRVAPEARRLLDVGANSGYLVRAATQAGFDALGLEPNAPAVEWGRTNLGAALEVGSIYDARPGFAGRFDVVTLFDVIEHLAEPGRAIERLLTYLAPGGRLFITTPDAGSLMARLLGTQWYYIDMFEHVSLFNRGNLTALLARHGLTVTSTRTLGRWYKLSYVERRLRQLSATSPMLGLATLAAQPLRLAPRLRMPVNLRDVMGVVATRAAVP